MFGRRLSRSDCHQAARNLQAYLDGELDATTSTVVAEHLEKCRRCGMELSTYEAIKIALSSTAGPSEADAAAVDRLRTFADGLRRQRP